MKETEIGDIFNLLPIPVTFTSYSGGTRNFFFLTFFRPERSNEEEEISTNDVDFCLIIGQNNRAHYFFHISRALCSTYYLVIAVAATTRSSASTIERVERIILLESDAKKNTFASSPPARVSYSELVKIYII